MVPDPYKALSLSHSASRSEIKNAYRSLARKYHPDRLVSASAETQRVAANQFPAITAAYHLLSDERRKRDYDHIYKFGGYDDEEKDQENQQPYYSGNSASRGYAQHASSSPSSQSFNNQNNWARRQQQRQKKRSMGIGYSMSDPVTYLFPSYATCGKKTCASIQIPARLSHPSHAAGGFKFCYSSGEFTTHSNGTKEFVSQTTQFVQGKKFTRFETTVVHPTGETQVKTGMPNTNHWSQQQPLAGLSCTSNNTTTTTKARRRPSIIPDDVTESNSPPHHPWYIDAWNGIREKLTSCHNPCGVIMVQ